MPFFLIFDDAIDILRVMRYKNRSLSKRIRALVERFPIVVVSGARQVGKSTMLKHLFGEYDLVLFDPVTDVGNARSDPDLFLDNHPSPLLLDEIQYAPELVPAIKRRVDQNKKAGMYILTGSQQWSVLQSISESLAGRSVLVELDSFSLAEIYENPNEEHWLQRYLESPDDFVHTPVELIDTNRTLYEQLWRGFLPEVDTLELEYTNDYFRSYLQTYIERDIRLLAEVNNPQQFGSFCQLSAALTAQEINRSQLGREIGITPQTAQRWLNLLTATFQWHEVSAFHGNAIKRVSAKHKGYFTDTGLACHLQMISSPKALSGHPALGSLFETFVYGEIRKLANTLSMPPRFHHWRSHGGAEVDLILERDGILYPIEIKLSSSPTKSDARGIGKFNGTYTDRKIAPGLVIAPVTKIQKLSEHAYSFPASAM